MTHEGEGVLMDDALGEEREESPRGDVRALRRRTREYESFDHDAEFEEATS